VRFSFIHAEKVMYPVRLLCRVLRVSPSGYYAWRSRPPSAHTKRDEQLRVQIVAVHESSRGTYGSPRVHRALRADGERIGRKRVARIMRENEVSGRRKRRFRKTTDSKHRLPIADNILARDFTAEARDQVWVGDITYVNTWEGWLYLAVLIDIYSRRVVGWAIADHMRTELVLDALNMAVGERRPAPGLVHHTDRGSQYASADYRNALGAHGMVCSMSRKGECWDNAVAESFFARLKDDLLYRRKWATKDEAKAAIREYIMCFYNARRLHSTLGYLSPIDYEKATAVKSLVA
jgi:putative transposase